VSRMAGLSEVGVGAGVGGAWGGEQAASRASANRTANRRRMRALGKNHNAEGYTGRATNASTQGA
jgi:hypothetical protein